MSEPWLWKVYVITCILTGMQYVGITKRSIEARWVGHLEVAYNIRSNATPSRLAKAIAKFGMHAFQIEQVASCKSPEDVEFCEVWLIEALGTFWPDGFNSTKGGKGAHGRIVEQEQPIRHSAFLKAAWANLSEEEKAAWIDRMTAAHRTPESRAKRIEDKKSWWANLTPEQRKEQIERMHVTHKTPEYRARVRQQLLRQHKDPKFTRARLAGLRRTMSSHATIRDPRQSDLF